MTLTVIRPKRTITIPKRVRDNMGLFPNDSIEFSADEYSTFVHRAMRESVPIMRAGDDPAQKDFSRRYVVTVSSAGELVLPKPLFEDLMLEVGSIVGFFRDSIGYRFIPIYNPTRFGPQTGSADEGGIQIVENSIAEYSVAVTREARCEIAYQWQDVDRNGDDDPFMNVTEPAPDRDILDELTKNHPAFIH